MNRRDLDDAVAVKIGGKIEAARAAIDAALSVINEAIARGEDVRLVRFGTFLVQVRPPRNGRSIATGTIEAIPEKRVVKFRPGSELKAAAGMRTRA
jgi:nucleoid DNA-binding protein